MHKTLSITNMHKARKRFGQHFLTNNIIIKRIVDTIIPKIDDNLLEIGPGQGAITLPLLSQVKTLNVVEIDKDLIVILKSFNQTNLKIHEADILKFEINTLPTPIRIVGNLPYNISSPILFHLLNDKDKIIDMTFMLQKELVERMVAKSGSKIYGRLSVMIQAFFKVELVFTVPPNAFTPAPKIDSAIAYFKPINKSKVKNAKMFEKVVKIAFAKRRKTLKNCLKPLLIQEHTKIDLSKRAEDLSVDDFITLIKDYEKQH